MTPYLVYLPSGARGDSPHTVFIADRFAWLAFVFPAFWLFFKRQWIAGIVVLLVQGALTTVSGITEAVIASILVELALRLLVGLEGSAFLAYRLEKKGYTLAAVLPAPDLATAEAMYGSALETSGIPDASALPRLPATKGGTGSIDPANPGFGLFDTYGSR
jgi:hypothetical protein